MERTLEEVNNLEDYCGSGSLRDKQTKQRHHQSQHVCNILLGLQFWISEKLRHSFPFSQVKFPNIWIPGYYVGEYPGRSVHERESRY